MFTVTFELIDEETGDCVSETALKGRLPTLQAEVEWLCRAILAVGTVAEPDGCPEPLSLGEQRKAQL